MNSVKKSVLIDYIIGQLMCNFLNQIIIHGIRKGVYFDLLCTHSNLRKDQLTGNLFVKQIYYLPPVWFTPTEDSLLICYHSCNLALKVFFLRSSGVIQFIYVVLGNFRIFKWKYFLFRQKWICNVFKFTQNRITFSFWE